MRFYVDELGLERLPTPDFGFPVGLAPGGRVSGAPVRASRRLRPRTPTSGSRSTTSCRVYRRMKELGALDHVTFGNAMYELPDGGIQMYVRDPAGNLVELDYRDASTIPRTRCPSTGGSPTCGPRTGTRRAPPSGTLDRPDSERRKGRPSRAPLPLSPRVSPLTPGRSALPPAPSARDRRRAALRSPRPGARVEPPVGADADRRSGRLPSARRRRSASGSGAPSGGTPSRRPVVKVCSCLLADQRA